MSQEEIKEKAKQTLKSAQEFVDSLTDAAHAELAKAAPKLTQTLDAEFDKAIGVFSDTLKAADQKSAKEQAELLGAYRSFLRKQTELIDRRLKEVEGK
jgi:ABC-type transporter Mla subunit MlaD